MFISLQLQKRHLMCTKKGTILI